MINPFTCAQDLIAWVEKQKRFSPKVGLKKMQYFCELFGHPERTFLSIHVTGTNGKGSTVAMLKEVLSCNGCHVATYTSPYVTCFNERIAYDGIPISDEAILYYGNFILTKYDQMILDHVERPTFFEFITLMAFLYFASLPQLDIAIIEVGMGGRLDATNVITPLISIITNIAMDHMAVLGDSLEKILTEKLGIVKNAIPVVTGITDLLYQRQILADCQNKNTYCRFIHPEQIQILKRDLSGSMIQLPDGNRYHIALAGEHQIENALVVMEAIHLLSDISKNTKRKFVVSSEILKRGLAQTTWVGRLERVSEQPLIVIDGGHNVDGITRVCHFIRSLSEYTKKRCIIAISHDKALPEMMQIVDETFDEVICTEYTYSRSASAAEIYELSQSSHKRCISSIDEAIQICYEDVVDLTIFLGSLYLVSEVRTKFKQKV